MDPVNSLHASAYYSDCNERLNFYIFLALIFLIKLRAEAIVSAPKFAIWFSGFNRSVKKGGFQLAHKKRCVTVKLIKSV